jgi:hypothetical protein
MEVNRRAGYFASAGDEAAVDVFVAVPYNEILVRNTARANRGRRLICRPAGDDELTTAKNRPVTG